MIYDLLGVWVILSVIPILLTAIDALDENETIFKFVFYCQRMLYEKVESEINKTGCWILLILFTIIILPANAILLATKILEFIAMWSWSEFKKIFKKTENK